MAIGEVDADSINSDVVLLLVRLLTDSGLNLCDDDVVVDGGCTTSNARTSM